MDSRYVPVAGQVNRYRELVNQGWQEALDVCAADEAHFAIPDDAAEISAIQLGVGAWIGISDIAIEGVWITVDARPATYLPWGANEPSGGTNENRVELYVSTFNDLNCVDHRRNALCECEL